jgi:LPS export ABC transporter protein LptC
MGTVKNILPLLFTLFILFSGCTFDYGETSEVDDSQPDIVMNDVEYVRIRGGDPVVRFRAESAERYEKKQTMELRNFSFEQFQSHGDEINATGMAGSAHVDLESGDIVLGEGISIEVDSEDITIKTETLSWYDQERVLTGKNGGVVDITRSDGTSFYGKGFTADIRYRTWEFTDGIEGTYVDEDDEEEPDEAVDEEELEAEPLPGDAITDDIVTDEVISEEAGMEGSLL